MGCKILLHNRTILHYNSPMHANLYATFRIIAGVKTIDFELPTGATIRSAIDEIIHQRPVLRRHWLDSKGQLYPHVHIIVNGQDASTLPEQLDTPLRPDDSLDFFPPVAGGSEIF